MPQTINRASLDRLIALGRERGALGPDDLHSVLPIDTMGVEDVVLVILELEDAGVSVEPDVFGPAHTNPAALRLPKPPPPSTVAVEPTAPTETPSTTVQRAASHADPAPRAEPPGEAERVHRTVALAGLATFLVLAALLLLI